MKIVISANKTWTEVNGKANHVSINQDLPITMGSGTDPNGWNTEVFCDCFWPSSWGFSPKQLQKLLLAPILWHH